MEKQIQTAVVFQTYAVILNLLNKCLLMLAERRADQATLKFMVQTINALIQNINQYAGELALEQKWERDLNEICDKFHISRASMEQEESPENEDEDEE